MADLKQAYRDQLFIWHPDRFQQNPRLRAKSEERCKLISTAFDFLTTRHGQFSTETLTDDDSDLRERLRAVTAEIRTARADAEEARRKTSQAELDAHDAEDRAAEALALEENARTAAKRLQDQLAESRRLVSFWCERATEERQLHQRLEITVRRKGWRRAKSWFGGILGFIGFVRLAQAIGVLPSLMIFAGLLLLATAWSRRGTTNPANPVIPPPMPGNPLSHSFEQPR